LTFFSKPNLTFISFRVIHSFYPSFSIRFCSLFFPSFQFNRQNLSPFSLLLHIFFVLCFNCLIYFSFPTQFEAVCLSVYWKLWLRTEIPAAGKASQRAKGTKQIRCFSLAIGPNFVLPIVNSVSCKFWIMDQKNRSGWAIRHVNGWNFYQWRDSSISEFIHSHSSYPAWLLNTNCHERSLYRYTSTGCVCASHR
jgi:hypothetical protein